MYKFISFLFSFLLLFSLNAVDYQVIEDQATLKILNPNLAKRETKKIKLNNGLQALIISDPEAVESGAMLSVNVGSFEDPEEYPGLAHFLEHMLFLGTKKYPIESEYQQYITKNGGQANAFTTTDTTSYLFTVQTDAFDEALDRFAGFFKEPLFNPSGVARELNAIDQEYAKNIENDSIRQIYVLKEQTNASHPFHKFNMGNSESLQNASKNILENWYRTHYSANLMRLVIYSPLSIDESINQVVSKFRNIPTIAKEPYAMDGVAFSPDGEGKYIYIQPVKDIRSLTIIWQLDAEIAKMEDTRPDALISHLLGHEGKNSLLEQLKREKLAIALASGATRLGDDFMILSIKIDLTEKGLKSIQQVITRVFQAIANLKERGLPKYVFDEVKKMAEINYQYQSKENEFTMLMKHGLLIHDENFASYPEKTNIIKKYSKEDFLGLVNTLTPANARFFILAPTDLTSAKADMTERWIGVKYSLKPIPKDIFKNWQRVLSNAEIDIPPPNEFIPDNLDLKQTKKTKDTVIPMPEVITDNDRALIYFSPDTKFNVPKVSWILQLKTPGISLQDPAQVAMGELFIKCLKDDLSNFAYSAQIGGLQYEITREDNGIKIAIVGLSNKAYTLLEEIVERIKTHQPSSEMFNIYKEALQRKYQNFSLESPYKQALELFKSVQYNDYVLEKEKLAAIRKITHAKFSEWVKNLFNETFIEATLYGNMDLNDAKQASNLLLKSFDKGIYKKDDHFKQQVVILPQDSGPHFVDAFTKAQGNVAYLAIENDSFSFVERAAQQILMQAIEEPFYSNLRTQQQTGYLVFSYPEEVERMLFNFFAVQSNTHDPRDLLARFEEFIESFLQESKTELPKNEFLSIKKALITKYEEPAKNIKEMGELLFHLAFKYDGDFLWIDKRVEGLKQVTYPEFLVLAKNFLGRENKKRLAILLKGEIPRDKRFSYTRSINWNTIKRASKYTSKD